MLIYKTLLLIMLALNYNAEGQFTTLPPAGVPFRWRFKIAIYLVIR